MAALALPAVIKGAGTLVGALLAQHTARLNAAKNENAALDALIPAFDADIQAVAAAYNSGTSESDCINALYAIDNNAYSYLFAQVGKSGTAWGGPSTGSLGTAINPSYHADCNKSCTAGCCVYLNDLRPAIFGRSGVGTSYGPYQTSSGIVGGLIEAIQRGGGTVKVIPVAKPSNTAYGNYQRDSYTLTVTKPPASASVTAAVLSVSGSGTNLAVTATPPAATTQAVSALTNPIAALTSNSTVAILTVVTAFILIITALFGQKALQVAK